MALVAVLLLAPAGSLHGQSPEGKPLGSGPGSPGWAFGPTSPSDPVLARVGQVAIHRSAVERAATSAPAGATLSQLLDELIDQELLAQRAARRGYQGHRDAVDDARTASVRLLLREDFEPLAQKENIPEDVLRKAYRQNIAFFQNPLLVRTAHVLLKVPDKADESIWETTRQSMAEVRAIIAAAAPETEEEFRTAALTARDRFGELLYENLGYIPRHGRLVEPFAAAAFALESDGDLSEPVRTRFGWHVLFRYGLRQPRNISFEEAADDIRERAWDDWRTERFRQWLEELLGRHRVERHSEELDALKPNWMSQEEPGGGENPQGHDAQD